MTNFSQFFRYHVDAAQKARVQFPGASSSKRMKIRDVRRAGLLFFARVKNEMKITEKNIQKQKCVHFQARNMRVTIYYFLIKKSEKVINWTDKIEQNVHSIVNSTT